MVQIGRDRPQTLSGSGLEPDSRAAERNISAIGYAATDWPGCRIGCSGIGRHDGLRVLWGVAASSAARSAMITARRAPQGFDVRYAVAPAAGTWVDHPAPTQPNLISSGSAGRPAGCCGAVVGHPCCRRSRWHAPLVGRPDAGFRAREASAGGATSAVGSRLDSRREHGR